MKIDVLPLGHIGANCYMILSEDAAIVIDPGLYSEKIEAFLNRYSEKNRFILLTHAHFDHIIGAKKLRENTGVQIAIGKNDGGGLSDTALSMSDYFRAHQEPFSADILLDDEQILKIGDLTIKVIETPGHTVGGVCYLIGDSLFSGDTLFYESVGRTDFGNGDYLTLQRSIGKLMELDDSVTVYPGHGEPTVIGHERQFNPFLK